MEKGFYVNEVNELDNKLEQIDYIYYGSEFCINKFVRNKEYDLICKKCLDSNKRLCILTPIIPEAFWNHAISFIDKFASYKQEIEIVVNDLGLLNYINKFYQNKFIVTLGRLLNRVKKAPSILNYFEKLNSDSKEALQTSSCNDEKNLHILYDNNIKNIQYDNIIQKNHITHDNNIEKHLWYPYVQITTARKCIASCLEEDAYFFNNICNQSCDNTYYQLYNDVIKRKIILCGNTLFYKNAVLPDNYLEFNRIIFNGSINSDSWNNFFNI